MKGNVLAIFAVIASLATAWMEHTEKMATIERGIESTRVISEAAQLSGLAALEKSCLEHHLPSAETEPAWVDNHLP